jgi:hypothetical protein
MNLRPFVWAATMTLAVFGLIGLPGCGPVQTRPDTNTGGDGSRDEAAGLSEGRSMTDRLEGEGGDNTDWKYLDLDEIGTLTVTVNFDHPERLTGAYVDLYDAFGARIRREDVTPDQTAYTFRDEVEESPSKRYIRLYAQNGTSIYTIGARLVVRAPPEAPKPTGVQLSFTPADAQLKVDGGEVPQFEQGGVIILSPGAHKIEIKKRRYETFEVDLDLAEQVVEVLNVTLDKSNPRVSYGSLVVNVTPASAALKVGSKRIIAGATTRIRTGRHRVVASASGYKTKKVTARVQKKKTATLDITLSRKPQSMTGTVYRVTPSESNDSITIHIRFPSELAVANGTTATLYREGRPIGKVRLSNINGKRAQGVGRIRSGKATGRLTVKVSK